MGEISWQIPSEIGTIHLMEQDWQMYSQTWFGWLLPTRSADVYAADLNITFAADVLQW